MEPGHYIGKYILLVNLNWDNMKRIYETRLYFASRLSFQLF